MTDEAPKIPTPKPSQGRIVIYVDHDGRRSAPAIVSWVYADCTVAITVFWVGAMPEPLEAVRYDEGGGPGTWHWPPRV